MPLWRDKHPLAAYTVPMLSWLRKKRQHDYDDLVQERWETSFTRKDDRRFPPEEEGMGYVAGEEKQGYRLSLEKKQIFAWVEDPVYRYEDLLLEADVHFDSGNGYSAAGFLFRYIEEGGYYSFLVSNRGHFRLDLVFNGKPRTLIPWTPAPEPEDDHIYLRIIVRDSGIVCTVNEQWVAELEDENLKGGRIAFAGQNYDEKETAGFTLEKLRVDSIPVDIEASWYRWNKAVKPERPRRILLAESLYSGGSYPAAAVQLKKAFTQADPSAPEYFLLAECCMRLGLYDEALAAVDNTLKIDPAYSDAIKERGNLLYILNHFLELRDYIAARPQSLADDPMLLNLLGHGEFGVGNWAAAADAYAAAAAADPSMPLYLVNAARAKERCGRKDEAVADYLQAARLYFRQEAYYDLEGIIPALQELVPDNPEVRGLEGKVLFGRGDYSGADEIFREQLEAGSGDSSICFLHGMVQILTGRRDVAAEYLLRATELEPEYYLYWLRLADNLHAMGLDAGDEIQRAIDLAPDDPWVLNLAGLIRAEEGDFSVSRQYLSRAAEKAPEEEEIQANMAYLISREEGLEAGIAYIDGLGDTFPESHILLNQRANFLVELDLLEEAVMLYEKAVRMAPENRDYRMNCASACLKGDMISRAEELYQELLEDQPEDPASMTGIGNCAWVKSEFIRAEAAYREAVRIKPEAEDAWSNLVELLYTMRRFPEAKKAVADAREVLGDELPPRLAWLAERITGATEDRYSCADCGLSWAIEKSDDPVPPLRLHGEPPGNAPAGKCSECGKVFCVTCASSRVQDSRLICECGAPLKLNEAPLRRILLREIERS